MTTTNETGRQIAARMLGEETARLLEGCATSSAFGAKRGDFALRWAFSEVWARPGLEPRIRSLVTLGILIALGQKDELRLHILGAIRNGCTVKEIEEVLYQAIPYAGFPAANTAAGIAAEVLTKEGLIG